MWSVRGELEPDDSRASCADQRVQRVDRFRKLLGSVAARPGRLSGECHRVADAAVAAPSRSGSSIISRQALDTASRWPARLPLSTVDTYSGSSRCSVSVSYQL